MNFQIILFAVVLGVMGGRQLQSCFGRQILGGDFLGGVGGLLGFGSFGGAAAAQLYVFR